MKENKKTKQKLNSKQEIDLASIFDDCPKGNPWDKYIDADHAFEAALSEMKGKK